MTQRLASLLPSATEMLFGLGLADQMVAVGHECNFPAAARKLPRATRSWIDSAASSDHIDRQVRERLAAGEPLYEVHAELLVELRPTLIVTQAQCDVCAVRHQDVLDLVAREPALRDCAVVALNPQSADDVLADILRLGAATGADHAAQRWCAALAARFAEHRSLAAQLGPTDRPRTAIIEWTDPVMLAGNWTPQLLDWAGGQCGLTPVGEHSRYFDWNELAAFDPEVIVVAPCGFDLPRAVNEALQLQRHPQWSALTAVRRGRVYALDGDAYLNRAGPRLAESLDLLAHLLHPARRPAPACERAFQPICRNE